MDNTLQYKIDHSITLVLHAVNPTLPLQHKYTITIQATS